MLKVVAKHNVKTDKLEEFVLLAKKLVQETNLNDGGCIRYELFQDIKTPQILTIIEEWDSQEALNRHMEAKHFKEIFPLLQDLLTIPGEVNLYQKLL